MVTEELISTELTYIYNLVDFINYYVNKLWIYLYSKVKSSLSKFSFHEYFSPLEVLLHFQLSQFDLIFGFFIDGCEEDIYEQLLELVIIQSIYSQL
jgi:hypothetical protein